MAFDGIMIRSIIDELNDKIVGGRIDKVYQPESDEIILGIRSFGVGCKLLLTANPSHPRLQLTERSRENPPEPPLFCMVLRKHLGGGVIDSITQPGLERCVDITVSHLDEMGDMKQKILTVELMGKHSNIIFREGDKIIESLKHIPLSVSSVREVLPGRNYFIPVSEGKIDIINNADDIESGFNSNKSGCGNLTLRDHLIKRYTGLSPFTANEIAFRAGIDPSSYMNDVIDNEKIIDELKKLKDDITKGDQDFLVYYDENDIPVDFSVFKYGICSDLKVKRFDSMSDLLIGFYNEKKNLSILRSKSSDLTHIVKTMISRNAKKLDLQLKQLKDTEKKDKYQLYGELLNIYGYDAKPGDKEIKVVDYHTEKEITIPLDDTLSALQNAKKYYDRYAKLKRTYEALSVLTKETEEELDYLKGVLNSIELAENEDDLNGIRQELYSSGFMRKKTLGKGKSKPVKSEPLKFLSSDGDIIYVGKNNLQNEEITFKLADNRDWWFHAKGLPGSHVLLKCAGKEPSDKAFEEAARLAAHYSAAGESDKVEIDYVKRKEVKKPAGARPGYVIYHTNFSMVIDTDISDISRA